MKKLLVLISTVAAILTACNNKATNQTSVATDSTGFNREISTQIAYIQLDTLMSRYEMVLELGDALQTKATKAENDVLSKRRNLERSVADYQEKVEKGLVTRAQAAELEDKLNRQQQTYMQQAEQIQMEIAEENQVMMNNISHSINKFIEEFNKDYRYSMILTTTGLVPILHADPALDITEIVVKGLNEQYAKEKNN